MTDMIKYSGIELDVHVPSVLFGDIEPITFHELNLDGDGDDGGTGGDGANADDDGTGGGNNDDDDGGTGGGNDASFTSDGLEAVTLENDEGSYFINADGAVVNDKGEVKLSKDDYAKLNDSGNVDDVPDTFKTVGEIEGFEGTVYLNENKEFVNAKGEVLLDADSVAKDYDIEGADESNPFITGLEKSNIFDNLEGVEFTEEGVTTVVNTVYDKGINKGKADGVNELYQRYPELQDVLTHMELHGTDFSKYKQFTDYNALEITAETSTGVLDAIVRDYHREKGIKPDQNYINFLKNGDGYIDYVKGIKSELADISEQHRAAQRQKVEESKLAARQQAENYWGLSMDDKGNQIELDSENSIYNKVIKQGTITVDGETLNIPKVIKSNITGEPKEYSVQDFFNWLYVTRPVEVNGERINATGYELARYNKESKRTIDNDIVDAFTIFTNGDGSQLIKQSVNKHKKQHAKKITVTKKRQPDNKQTTVKRKLTL